MVAKFFTTAKSNDRLTQLWEELLADPVPPRPIAKGQSAVGRYFDININTQPVPVMGMDKPIPVSYRWRADLAKLFHSLLEPQVAESPPDSAVEAISEGEASPEASLAAAHEASLALSTPFHWEPKPAWIAAPARPSPQFSNTVHPQRFAPSPKIPLRPLHKQPFYKRFFFYVHRWLSGPK